MHDPRASAETCGRTVSPLDDHLARALHDIARFRTTVIHSGTLGRIVGMEPGGTGLVYSVEFWIPHTCGATVRVEGLTGSDVSIH